MESSRCDLESCFAAARSLLPEEREEERRKEEEEAVKEKRKCMNMDGEMTKLTESVIS